MFHNLCSLQYAFYFPAATLCVFAVCSLIEYIRIVIVDRLIIDNIRPLDRLCRKADMWYAFGGKEV